MLEGTHQGDGLGVAPTGRRVRVAGIVMARIEDGKIVEAWNNWDQLGLLRQIGAMPGNESGDRFLARA
jgi:predicted ester cyclase